MLSLYVAPTARLVLVGPRGQRLEFGREHLPRERGQYTPIRDGGGLIGWIERTRGGAGNVGVTAPLEWRVFTSDRPWRGGEKCSA